MTGTPAVPSEQALLGLAADEWTLVLGHARAVLNDVDDAEADAMVKRLRSAPAGRLAGGRMRRDLVAAIRSRPRIWSQVHERLAADPAAGSLEWLVAGDQLPPAGTMSDSPARTTPRPKADRTDKAARLQSRLGEVREERDALKRRLDGAEARASRAERVVEDLEQVVTELRAELAQLREAVDAEQTRTAAAVEREQRRQAARISELERELSDARRGLDEFAQLQRAAERRRAAATAPTRESANKLTTVIPGRPSRLPAGLRLDTTEGAQALMVAADQVFVDGWNVTKTNWAKLPFDQHRQRLRRALEAAAARYGCSFTVVYDGQGEGDQSMARGVRQVFTPDAITADDELVFRVAALDPDAPVVVVTDDAELRERLAGYHPDLLGTRPFLWAIQ
jgi:hypothetical protein